MAESSLTHSSHSAAGFSHRRQQLIWAILQGRPVHHQSAQPCLIGGREWTWYSNDSCLRSRNWTFSSSSSSRRTLLIFTQQLLLAHICTCGRSAARTQSAALWHLPKAESRGQISLGSESCKHCRPIKVGRKAGCQRVPRGSAAACTKAMEFGDFAHPDLVGTLAWPRFTYWGRFADRRYFTKRGDDSFRSQRACPEAPDGFQIPHVAETGTDWCGSASTVPQTSSRPPTPTATAVTPSTTTHKQNKSPSGM